MGMRSIGALFSDSIAFYKSHAALLAGIMLVPALVQMVFIYLVGVEGGPSFSSSASLVLFLVLIAFLLINIIGSAAAILAIANPGAHPTIMSAYKPAIPLFFPFLWLGVLVSLIMLGGFVLLVIPGIIFSVWFSLSYFTFLIEGKRGWQALKASKEYVKGKWWPVFGRLVVVTIAMVAASVAIDMVLGLILPGMQIRQAIGTLVTSVVITPILLTYMYLMYKDLSTATPASAPTPGNIV